MVVYQAGFLISGTLINRNMKIKLLFFLSLSLIINMSCKKKNVENQVYNDITFLEINKLITATGKDSIVWECRPLIFKIMPNKHIGFYAILIENAKPIQCNESISCITDFSNNVLILNNFDIIYSNRTWKFANELGLSNFAGKGEKYIGFRMSSNAVQEYYYGWIKIELTENIDTLKIISTAYRNIPNRSISAGEVK
jgi:hypothetical protein